MSRSRVDFQDVDFSKLHVFHMQLLDENRWYNFDDSHISPINEEDVKSGAAYVLFYKRVNNDRSSASNGVNSTINSQNIDSNS